MLLWGKRDMYKIKIFKPLILFFVFFYHTGFAQVSNETYYNNLYYTCKVWGYLKYFHSSLNTNAINWDNVLIQNLSDLKNVASDEEFNNFLTIFFDAAGQMKNPVGQKPNVPEDLRYNLNTDWFNDAIFSSEIKQSLLLIDEKFRPTSNYYVSSTSAGNPTFYTDNQYYNSTSSTPEQRILGLFRYWNIINYFYPSKNLLDKNWDDVLKEMIPKFVNTTSDESYNIAVLELTANLNDAHAKTNSAIIAYDILGSYYLPLILKYIENKTVVFEVGKDITQLKPGDIIFFMKNGMHHI